jgi:hypothetical protein
MATFGSTVGQYNASRDFLAEALANAGQTAGQALANTGQAIGQGIQHQQNLKAQQEQKKLAMMQGELDDARAEAQRLMTPGADPTQIDALYNQRRTDILGKYGMGGKPDNVATALTPTPTPQPQQPQPARQAQQPGADNVAAALTPQAPKAPQMGAGGTFEGGQMPGNEKPATPQERPALTLSPASVYANSQENVKKTEAAKNEREGIEAYRKQARGLRITDDQIDKDPDLSRFKGRTLNDWENIVAIAAEREAKRKERAAAIVARIQGGKDSTDNALQLKSKHESAAKPYQEVIDKGANVTTLLKENTPQANAAAIKTFSRMLEPGVVTESDIRILSSPGGLIEKAIAEMQRAKDGKMTPETQQALGAAVQRILANAQKDRDLVNADYEDTANMLGINPRLVVGRRYISQQKPAEETYTKDTW